VKRSRVVLGLVSRDGGVVRCATGELPVAQARRIRPRAAVDVAEVQSTDLCRVFDTLGDGSAACHVVPLLDVLAEASVLLERAPRQILGFRPRVPIQRVAAAPSRIDCLCRFLRCL
jgi:hypothetical protein